MRFPTGLLAQYITRKWAAMLEMGLITIGLAYGYFFVDTFQEVIWMGIPLGIAGASFGIALSWAAVGTRQSIRDWLSEYQGPETAAL